MYVVRYRLNNIMLVNKNINYTCIKLINEILRNIEFVPAKF
jgi:hypothetical protein